MKRKDIINQTKDRREYNLLIRHYNLYCSYCPPNKGCNLRIKRMQRNWKKFRKTQWKNPIVHRVNFGE